MNKKSNINVRDKAKNVMSGKLTCKVRNVLTGETSVFHEDNIIKASAKEIMAMSLAPQRVWDPNAQEWVANTSIDDLSVRYMWFGTAADSVLETGFNYNGSLKEAIPISVSNTPLKRIEAVHLLNSYQPAGNAYNYDDVRPVLNEIVFETVMKADEYNEMPDTAGSDVILAEAGLVAAAEIELEDECNCTPDILFTGSENDGTAIPVTLTGSELISINPSSSKHTTIKAGDCIKIVASGNLKTDEHDIVDQHNAYYMVVSKLEDGRDLLLDRTPRNSDNEALTGSLGIYRVGHRMICYKKIPPFKKSYPLEITFSWSFLVG